MADHSKQRLLFQDVGGKKIEADFLGGEVTSDAGLLLFREVDRKLRLTERVAPLLRERREAQIDTIQKAVVKIGARVRELRRKIKVHLPTSYPWAEALTRVWESLYAT